MEGGQNHDEGYGKTARPRHARAASTGGKAYALGDVAGLYLCSLAGASLTSLSLCLCLYLSVTLCLCLCLCLCLSVCLCRWRVASLRDLSSPRRRRVHRRSRARARTGSNSIAASARCAEQCVNVDTRFSSALCCSGSSSSQDSVHSLDGAEYLIPSRDQKDTRCCNTSDTREY